MGGKQCSALQGAILLFAASCIGIPVLVMLFAVPLGGLLSFAEGWTFSDGFWWTIAVQLGGGMTLSDAQTRSLPGRLLGTLAAAWSIGIAIVSVGLSSAPVLEPLIEWLQCSGHEALTEETS